VMYATTGNNAVLTHDASRSSRDVPRRNANGMAHSREQTDEIRPDEAGAADHEHVLIRVYSVSRVVNAILVMERM
jgi:hypothetical protein